MGGGGGWRLEGLLSIQQLILIERGASRAGLIMLCDSRPSPLPPPLSFHLSRARLIIPASISRRAISARGWL